MKNEEKEPHQPFFSPSIKNQNAINKSRIIEPNKPMIPNKAKIKLPPMISPQHTNLNK